jgi:hypothetical protein
MTRQFVLAALLVMAAANACSKDDPKADGMGNGAGGGDGGKDDTTKGQPGSTAVPECLNDGETNFDCPLSVQPLSGSCAPAGECCHRSSNIAKLATLKPDEPAQVEYRLNFVDITNHPLTIGTPDLVRTAASRAEVCAGEQCLLWRFTAPRSGGKFVAGKGEVEIGVGAYNCDGTYSFYGPKAAPDRTKEIGESEPGRWQAVSVPADVDPTKDGIDRYHIPFATNKNREVARSIFVWPQDYSIDWELASAGFEITGFDTSEAGLDCMGTRDGFAWSTVGGFVSYSPLAGNDKDISNQILQTYCSLLGFGILPEGMKDKDCLTTERCTPGANGCTWLKLPDSLCPNDAAERAIFGCHLGAEGNVNGEKGYPSALDCSKDAPTEPLDPDKGATSKGQCCDPLGKSTSLPACNAYRTVGVFVAAAAEITDKPLNGLAPNCL